MRICKTCIDWKLVGCAYSGTAGEVTIVSIGASEAGGRSRWKGCYGGVGADRGARCTTSKPGGCLSGFRCPCRSMEGRHGSSIAEDRSCQDGSSLLSIIHCHVASHRGRKTCHSTRQSHNAFSIHCIVALPMIACCPGSALPML